MSLAKLQSIRQMPIQSRNAFLSALPLFAIGAIALPIFLYLAVRSEAWQVYVAPLAAAVTGVGGFIGVRLSLRGRVVECAAVLILSIIIASMLIGVFMAGTGLVTGILVVILSLQISSQTMPPRTAFRALLAGIASAAISGSMEVLAPDFQFNEPLLRPVILILAGSVAVFFTILVFYQFRAYALQTKLAISFLGVSFITVAAIVVPNSLSSRNAFVAQSQETLLGAAGQTAARVDGFISDSLNAVRADARLPGWEVYFKEPEAERAGGLEETETLDSLRALGLRDPVYILSYALFDRKGQKLLDSASLLSSEDESTRDYIQRPMRSGQPYASPVEFSPVTGSAAFYLSSPIRDASNEIIGVLRVRYDATVLQNLLEEDRGLAGSQSYPILLDENHVYLAQAANPARNFKAIVSLDDARIAELQVARRLPSQPQAQLVDPLPDLEQGLNAASTISNFQLTDNEQVHEAAAFKLRTQLWSIVFVQSQDAFLAPIEAQTRSSLLLAVFIAALVAALAGGVSQSLVAPLVRLTAVAQRVADGDLSTQATVENADEIGALANTFNQMTRQLLDSLATLERRVADRTRALETTTRISRRLSTILDQHALAIEVVEQIHAAFEYYYAQLYLFDETNANLILVGGSGDIGRQLMEQAHSIPQGKGLIGRAADTNAAVLVPDVSQEPDWLPNPFLPDTRAEVVVPISIGDKVLGVLDVQHAVVNGLSEEDLEPLLSIANQAAIALQNARSFDLVQQQAARETLMGDINQRIQSATTVQEALQVVVRELGHAPGVRRTGVRLRLTEDESRSPTSRPLPIPVEHNGSREALK